VEERKKNWWRGGRKWGRGGGGVVIRNRSATKGMTGFFIPPLSRVQRPGGNRSRRRPTQKLEALIGRCGI
jgi:hypothetical protein